MNAITVLTSGVVAAVVSSIVTLLGTFLGLKYQRRKLRFELVRPRIQEFLSELTEFRVAAGAALAVGDERESEKLFAAVMQYLGLQDALLVKYHKYRHDLDVDLQREIELSAGRLGLAAAARIHDPAWIAAHMEHAKEQFAAQQLAFDKFVAVAEDCWQRQINRLRL